MAAYKTGDHAAAIAWVDRLHRAGLPVSRNGYTAAVNACCALGNTWAAADVLRVMSEARVVPNASLYNTVLETICPPSEGGYSARARWTNDGGGGVAASADGSEGVESVGGRGSGSRSSREGGRAGGESAARSVVVGKEEREGRGEEEPPELEEARYPHHHHYDRPRTAAEKADSALSLFEEMWRREVPMNGVTYAMVICALLEAEREDEVLRLWAQVHTLHRTDRRIIRSQDTFVCLEAGFIISKTFLTLQRRAIHHTTMSRDGLRFFPWLGKSCTTIPHPNTIHGSQMSWLRSVLHMPVVFEPFLLLVLVYGTPPPKVNK